MYSCQTYWTIVYFNTSGISECTTNGWFFATGRMGVALSVRSGAPYGGVAGASVDEWRLLLHEWMST